MVLALMLFMFMLLVLSPTEPFNEPRETATEAATVVGDRLRQRLSKSAGRACNSLKTALAPILSGDIMATFAIALWHVFVHMASSHSHTWKANQSDFVRQKGSPRANLKDMVRVVIYFLLAN